MYVTGLSYPEPSTSPFTRAVSPASTYTTAKALSVKASIPMLVTVFGIRMEDRLAQFTNALSAMVATPLGSVMLVNAMQSANAHSVMISNAAGMFTCARA